MCCQALAVDSFTKLAIAPVATIAEDTGLCNLELARALRQPASALGAGDDAILATISAISLGEAVDVAKGILLIVLSHVFSFFLCSFFKHPL